MDSSNEGVYRIKPGYDLQSIESIATALNKSLEGLILVKSGVVSHEKSTEALLSLMDSEEEKVASLKRYRDNLTKSLVKSKYFAEARTTDQLALCIKLVRWWMYEHQKEFSFDVLNFPVDAIFEITQGDELTPLASIRKEIWNFYGSTMDDYATSFQLSRELEWVKEQIKAKEKTIEESFKSESATDQNEAISIASGFGSYINETHRSVLMPYLIKKYTNAKKEDYGYLLYALVSVDQIKPSALTANVSKLHRDLNQTFGDIGSRENLRQTIERLGRANDIEEVEIKRHSEFIRAIIKVN